MSDTRTSEERRAAAQIAAHESWANTPDRAAGLAPAHAALWQKFLDQCDGDPVRAKHLWKAHFLRLALKSAKARRAAAEARGKAEELTKILEAKAAAEAEAEAAELDAAAAEAAAAELEAAEAELGGDGT
jgi:hypothetical protein